MIFVTLGTQRDQFTRFLREVDNLIDTFHIDDEFIVQKGHTNYVSQNFSTVDFLSEQDFSDTINRADVIITHAGYGSLFRAIKSGKKIISIPRLKKYHEIIDDHQLDLLKKLSSEGYIINGNESLVKVWPQVTSFTPRPYDFKNQIVDNLKLYLDSLINR